MLLKSVKAKYRSVGEWFIKELNVELCEVDMLILWDIPEVDIEIEIHNMEVSGSYEVRWVKNKYWEHPSGVLEIVEKKVNYLYKFFSGKGGTLLDKLAKENKRLFVRVVY